MSGKQIITDWVMVPLVLVVLVGGFAMTIKAVETQNADLGKKLDAVHAELTALKSAQKNLVLRAAPATSTDAVKTKPDATKPDATKDATKDATEDATEGDNKDDNKKNDDDEPADVPL